MKVLVVSFFLLLLTNSIAQSESCQIVGKISIYLVRKGAFLPVIDSTNPIIYDVANASHNYGQQNRHKGGVILKVIEEKYSVVIEVKNDKLVFIIKAQLEKIFMVQKIYEELSSISAINWIETVSN